ncbi:MAG: hypothetical protein LC115_01685 [Bacteroidia bacterium]|nr:hypothetical protein [Bacteroidia bacterium]
MGYVAICILLLLSFYITFRLAAQFKLDLLQVIATNYWVCVLCGIWAAPDFWQEMTTKPQNWLTFGLFQGSLFIGIFYITGYLSAQIGIGYTGLMGKISLVIPILFSAIYFKIPIDFRQYIGICLALFSIVLIHYQPAKNVSAKEEIPIKRKLLLGAILWLGSGLIDINFKWFEAFYSRTVPISHFAIVCFGTSALIGAVLVGYQVLYKKKSLEWKSVIGGIGLGVPNYFSVVFLTKGLQHLPPTIFFTVNNIGLLIAANVVGFLFFKEHFSVFKWSGLILAVLAIGLLILG